MDNYFFLLCSIFFVFYGQFVTVGHLFKAFGTYLKYLYIYICVSARGEQNNNNMDI